MSPRISRRVYPTVLVSIEIDPEESESAQSTTSVHTNPAYLAESSGGRRIRNRRRSTLENIFSVTRQNVEELYKCDRMEENHHSTDEMNKQTDGCNSVLTLEFV